MRMFMPWGTTQEQATVHFTLHVSDCKWLLRFTRDEGTNSANARDYEEASYDGENIYYLSNIRSAVERQRHKGKKLPSNIATGQIYKGEVFAMRIADEVGPIWLSYASGCYFATRSNEFVEPAMVFDGAGFHYGPPRHLKVPARWKLTKDNPKFPISVNYLNEGIVNSPTGSVSLPSSYIGFTSAVYRVLSITNFNGLEIPDRTSLTLYRPHNTAEQLTSFVEYCVRLESVGFHSVAKSFQPVLPGITVVADHRMGDLIYSAEKGWPTLEQLKNDPYFQELRRINSSRRPWSRPSPLFLRLILCGLVIAPLVFLLLRRSRFRVH